MGIRIYISGSDGAVAGTSTKLESEFWVGKYGAQFHLDSELPCCYSGVCPRSHSLLRRKLLHQSTESPRKQVALSVLESSLIHHRKRLRTRFHQDFRPVLLGFDPTTYISSSFILSRSPKEHTSSQIASFSFCLATSCVALASNMVQALKAA
jgi:hypothetical protein